MSSNFYARGFAENMKEAERLAAQDNLGLTEAARTEVVSDGEDTTAGRLLKVGASAAQLDRNNSNIEYGTLYPKVFDFDFRNNVYKEYLGLSQGLNADTLTNIADFTRSTAATGKNAFGNIEEVGANQPRIVTTDNGNALLTEGGGENSKLYSEDLTDSSTTKIGILSVTNEPYEGYGNNPISSRNLVIPSTSNTSAHYVDTTAISNPISYANGDLVSSSVILESAGYEYVILRHYLAAGGGAGEGIIISLAEGSIVNVIGAPLNYSIEPVGTGYRVTLTSDIIDDSLNLISRVSVANSNSTASYSGDGTSGIYLTAWQIEKSYPSSYIKTEGASAVRAADNFSYTLPSGFNANGDWSLFVEFALLKNTGGNTRPFTITDGTLDTRITLYNVGNNTYRLIFVSDGSTSFVATNYLINTNEDTKVVVKKSGTQISLVINGVIYSDTVHTSSFSPDRIYLGRGIPANTVDNTSATYCRATLIAEAIPDAVAIEMTKL